MSNAEELLIAAVTPSHQVADDIRRSRELYRYLQPVTLSPTVPIRRSSTPNSFHSQSNLTSALSPFVQLAALRCNVIKAMLNVMDRDLMYFLAQATARPRDAFSDIPMFDTPEDAVFLGCSSVPLSGRVCEITIRESPDTSSQYPFFVVPDLSQDPRFSELDVVKGGPKYRFYAGTPITTVDGVNIGSLAVMDDRPRESLTEDEETCLGQTAAHIMSYLELNRQAIEGRQARRMGYGLNQFVAGKRSLEDRYETPIPSKKPKIFDTYGISEAAHDHKDDGKPNIPHSNSVANSNIKTNTRKGSMVTLMSDSDDEPLDTQEANDSKVADVDEVESRSHEKTFARAANLIRESLEVGDEGGVTFVAVSATVASPTVPRSHCRSSRTSSEDELGSTSDDISTLKTTPRTGGPARAPSFLLTSTPTPASILATSRSSRSSTERETTTRNELEEIDAAAIGYFVRKNPNGKLWSFDDDNENSSSDESASIPSDPIKSTRSRRKQTEYDFLKTFFPQARQLLMMPLWDASQGRISSVCFVWTFNDSHIFSKASELNYLNAFCQNIMAECSRIDAVMSDQQKSDFVGTISHEMRSPLHGILASTEFLSSESDMSTFQRSLVGTVDACGRTLLDTINHVLDFSKINSFEKSWQKSNRRKDRSKRQARMLGSDSTGVANLSSAAPPLLQLFGATNISSVLEEVVEGIAVGQMYTSNMEITDVSRAARGRSDHRMDSSLDSDTVEVIMDIQEGDWVFMTQPGAVRRVIMNVFGNAMKYTSAGSIKVRLQMTETDRTSSSSSSDKTMILTVTDTGKGISQRFLNSKLFIPFAQENALAPGTGLGLSICKSIITMLGGSIDVQSRINSGTTVIVCLPLTRPMSGHQSTDATPHSGSTSAPSVASVPDLSIPIIKQQALDCRVGLYAFGEPDQHLGKRELGTILKQYVEKWYELEVVDASSGLADIVILEEQDLHSFIHGNLVKQQNPALVVLCNDATRQSRATVNWKVTLEGYIVEFIAKPTGPYKLAKYLEASLERKRILRNGNLKTITEVPTPIPPNMHSVVTSGLQELNLSSLRGRSDSNIVQATEGFAASQTSRNAQMAITTPALEMNQEAEGGASFPFPVQEDNQASRSASGKTSLNLLELAVPGNNLLSPTSGLNYPTPTPLAPTTKSRPRMLLVDDNKINLKLLQTYLSKRQYTSLSCAEDGQIAAALATSSVLESFEVIFMDISMPIMNGFESTRAIRSWEESAGVERPAMIIALTGLASGRDQSEGFAAGCDIYMTKPVSFKEVGKLLDNWEAHQKLRGEEGPGVGYGVGGVVTQKGMAVETVEVVEGAQEGR